MGPIFFAHGGWRRAVLAAAALGLLAEAAIGLFMVRGGHVGAALLGRDFGTFWAAGHLLLSGAVGTVFHPAAIEHWITARFPFVHGVRLWSYPPSMALLVTPMGLVPPLAAWAAWQIAGLAALLGALRAVFGQAMLRRALPLLPVLPAVWDNLLVGQNACFTGALIILGYGLLDRRQGVAGAAFGALTIKPQLGLLAPVALLAGRHWRAIAAAALVALLLAALSALLFPGAWALFFRHVAPVMAARFRQVWGPTPIQAYMASPFFAVVALGLPRGLAWLVQSMVSAIAVVAMARLWCAPVAPEARASRLLASAALGLAATPFALDYDAVGASVLLVVAGLADPALRRGATFGFALVALAQPGWCLLLALWAHLPPVAWVAWFALGCRIAFAPVAAPVRIAPDAALGGTMR